jgi:CHAD domain-containing protein
VGTSLSGIVKNMDVFEERTGKYSQRIPEREVPTSDKLLKPNQKRGARRRPSSLFQNVRPDYLALTNSG